MHTHTNYTQRVYSISLSKIVYILWENDDDDDDDSGGGGWRWRRNISNWMKTEQFPRKITNCSDVDVYICETWATRTEQTEERKKNMKNELNEKKKKRKKSKSMTTIMDACYNSMLYYIEKHTDIRSIEMLFGTLFPLTPHIVQSTMYTHTHTESTLSFRYCQ